MDRKEVEQEIEGLDVESRRVAELLSGLKRIDAPSNFEFGVRARIANGAPAGPSVLFPVLKLAAPLALVFVIGAAMLFYGGLITGDQPVVTVEPPVTEETSFAPPEVATAPPTENVTGPRLGDQGPAEVTQGPGTLQTPGREARNGNAANRPRRPAPSVGPQRRDGSTDIALRPSTVISAPGTGGDVSLKDAFGIIGVTGELSSNGWTVGSTTDGGLAHRSGIRAGDVIESMDGLAITDKTKFKSPFTIKSVRVRRDGKAVDLKLTY